MPVSKQIALQNQINRLQKRIEALQTQSDYYSRLRLTIFVLGMVASLITFYALALTLGAVMVSATLVVFSGVVAAHRRVDDGLKRHQLWQKIKKTHLARIGLDWEHISPSLFYQGDSSHPFDIDIDISGARSLHQLLDTSVSVEGSTCLRGWLLTTVPDRQQILDRQHLIQRLTPLSLFRDKLTLQAMLVGADHRIHGKRILEWFAQQPPTQSLRPIVQVTTGLAFLNIVLFLLFSAGILPPLWLISFSLYFFILSRHWSAVGTLFSTALSLHSTLSRLQAIFQFLEVYSDHPILHEVCQVYQEHRPSRQLRRMNRVLAAAGVQANPIAWLGLNLTVPWDLYFAHRLNLLKAELADLMPLWLDAWFKIEALNSLANLAYLHPDYIFPEIVETPCLFQGVGLGHVLLPDDRKVRNNFTLNERGQVVIITGSNMSGKSTFLRTLGLTLSLTFAGGPVNATKFQTSLFRLYTCIRITDSLSDGISYFYAEVKRLKNLLKELEGDHTIPLFFLIDEIFKGTNNRERLIGSRAYIIALVKQNGVGLIATHDLELVRLADEIPQISNYHFREDVQDGQMVFDYSLRLGPCPTTNALKIMALEGLPVE